MSLPARTVSLVPEGPHSPFPVAPDDVPPEAVRVLRRTLLRHPGRDPAEDDDLARLLVAMVIAVLAKDSAALVSQYTRETGDVVAIQARN